MEQSHLSHVKYEVCFDETVQYVTMRFKTHIKGDEYRSALIQGIDCLMNKKYNKWLAASTSLIVINSEDQRWLLNEWIPASIKAGLQYFAAVLPLSTSGRNVIENMGNNVSNEFFTCTSFEDEQSALHWLKEQPNATL
jgi:hypothetical protein